MRELTSPILLVGMPWQNADLGYIAPFFCSDPVVCLRYKGKVYLVVPRMEEKRAQRILAGRRVCVLSPEKLGEAPPPTLAGWCEGLINYLQIKKTVIIPRDFPIGIAQQLSKAGIRWQVCSGPLLAERRKKNVAERKWLRYCQGVAARAMDYAVGILREAKIGTDGVLYDKAGPLTSERIKRGIHSMMLHHDCVGIGTIVACGRRSADPHAEGTGRIYAGRSIVIDIFPRHLRSGYWGDLTRTVVKGCPSPALAAMYETVKRGQLLALQQLGPGKRADLIYRSVVEYFEKCGFKTKLDGKNIYGFIHGLGHGVGLEIHEAPSLGRRPQHLQVGDIITVEPGLYYGQVGGVRIEDVVEITPTGCRRLYHYRDVFQL